MRSLVPFLLMCMLSGGPAAAEKITDDPNTSGTAIQRTTQEPDSRLAQQVTYLGGYKRLHTVADDLTKLTGVTIRAGQNKQDWPVRDVPLIVCARDMPLGRLLRAVASAAHVELRAERVTESDDKPIYRLFRNKKNQDALSSKLDTRVRANLELADWAWDALTTYASKSGASTRIPADKLPYPGAEQEIALVSRLLASLGPEGKARALAGDEISMRGSDAAWSVQVTDLFRYACTKRGCFDGAPAEPTDEETRNARVTVSIARVDRADYVRGGFVVHAHDKPLLVGPNRERVTHDVWSADAVELAKALATARELKIPPAPDIDAAMKAESRPSDPSLEALETEDDWKGPLLVSKVRIELPKKDRPTRADVIPALSQSSGLSIICEDFVSHKSSWENYVRVPPDSETAVASVLRGLSPHKSHTMAWFLDSNASLLVGWNDDWHKHHQNLVSADLLDGIRAKREGKGAELDDIVPLLALSHDQYNEWVRSTRDFPDGAGYVDSWDRPAWLLYNALSPEDRSLARSDAGLPLSKFEPGSVYRFFEDERKKVQEHMARQQQPSTDPLAAAGLLLFSDTKLAPSLVMRVKRVPLKYWMVQYFDDRGMIDQTSVHTQPNKLEKHSYVVEFTGKRDDADFRAASEWRWMQFPLFTFEREAELAGKAKPIPKAKK